MTFKGLRNKVVLVTGSTSGIGQAIAVRFAEEGARVAVNYYRGLDSADDTDDLIHQALGIPEHDDPEKAGDPTHYLVKADVSNGHDVARMVREVIDYFGDIDVLINNAGVQVPVDSHEHDMDDFDWVLGVNLRGSFVAAREVIDYWVKNKRGGTIINISSVHQIIPKPRFLSYSISKGGMQNLTRTLALEYAGQGIRVNAVAPGATVTPINDAWTEDPEKKAAVESHIPMGRAGTSEEMAAITAFLCSDEAQYITGQTIYVDGGLTLYPDFRTSWSSE